MKMRRFTSAGIIAVKAFLADIKASGQLDLVRRDQLLAGPLTEPIPALADLDLDAARVFDTTFAFCEYFDSLIHDHNPQAYRTDVGFWTWLAMAYLPQLVKVSAEGKAQLGDKSRICYEAQSHMLAHRHLLASAYDLYLRSNGDARVCRLVLLKKPNVYTMLSEELLSRQSVLHNIAFMIAADALYFDDEAQCPKKGCTVGSGSIRRLISMIDQIGMTRDFFEQEDALEFLSLLPSEFNRFKKL